MNILKNDNTLSQSMKNITFKINLKLYSFNIGKWKTNTQKQLVTNLICEIKKQAIKLLLLKDKKNGV
jgi:hypothetical protein